MPHLVVAEHCRHNVQLLRFDLPAFAVHGQSHRVIVNTPPHRECSSSRMESFEACKSAESSELRSWQCLGEEVSNIIRRVDPGESYFLCLDALAKKVIFNVYVLDARV